MIIKQIALDTVISRTGTSVKSCINSILINDPAPVNDIDYCEYECKQEYFAFAFNNEELSDFFTATEPISLDSDTTEFILIDSSGVEYPITDSAYADLIESDKMHYCKFQWYRIFNTLGGGRYTIQTKKTSLGVETVSVFGTFLLVAYDEKVADGTMVIEGSLNGSIESYGDFQNDDISYFMRFTGNSIYAEVIEDERVNQANRIEVNSHKRKHSEYEVEINHVSFEFQNYLRNIWLMVDEIYIKSYTILSPLYLEKIRILVNDREVKEGVGSRQLNYLISAEDSKKDNIWHPPN